MLMATKGVLWQPFYLTLLQLGGVAAASQISTQDSLHATQIDVFLMYRLHRLEILSVGMVSERETRSVTVEVNRSAQILAAMLPPAS